MYQVTIRRYMPKESISVRTFGNMLDARTYADDCERKLGAYVSTAIRQITPDERRPDSGYRLLLMPEDERRTSEVEEP